MSWNSWRRRVRTSPMDRYERALIVASPGGRSHGRLHSPLAKRYSILNLPIWTSSPLARAGLFDPGPVDIGPVERAHIPHRGDLVPVTNSAWRRDTVMSSRKMSLSGWRPAWTMAGLEREPDAVVRAPLDHQHPHAAGELQQTGLGVEVARLSRVLHRAHGHRGVRSRRDQRRAAGRAEVDSSGIAMAATGTEHAFHGSRSISPLSWVVRRPATVNRRSAADSRWRRAARPLRWHPRARSRRSIPHRTGRCRGLGGVRQGGVHGHHLPGHRSIDLRDRFGGLHLPEQTPRLHRRARSREVHEDHVTERVLGEVGDPHPDPIAVARAHSWSVEYLRSSGTFIRADDTRHGRATPKRNRPGRGRPAVSAGAARVAPRTRWPGPRPGSHWSLRPTRGSAAPRGRGAPEPIRRPR